MNRDFSYRQDRVLPDGMPSLARNLLKPVRILGARYQFESLGTSLSCTGEPSALSGDLTITFLSSSEDVPYDCDASTLETALNSLLAATGITGTAVCGGGPLPATPITITMPKSRLLKVQFGLIRGGNDVGTPDDLWCSVLDDFDSQTKEVVNVACLTPHYAVRLDCQAFKSVDQWYIAPEASLFLATAKEKIDAAVPSGGITPGGEIDVFNTADRQTGANLEAVQVLEDELIEAWPYQGGWLFRRKFAVTMWSVRATEDIAAGATGSFQIQDDEGGTFPLTLGDTAHDPIQGLAHTDFATDDVGLATLVNGKWFEVSRKFCD